MTQHVNKDASVSDDESKGEDCLFHVQEEDEKSEIGIINICSKDNDVETSLFVGKNKNE